jgi:DNA-binding winged helix-turn-helix (wHTH) protein
MFAVLHYLVTRPGQLVTKEELLSAVWSDTYVSNAALKACIRRTRAALQDDPKAPRFIETVQRRGYRFIGPVTSSHYAVARCSSVLTVQRLKSKLLTPPLPVSTIQNPFWWAGGQN